MPSIQLLLPLAERMLLIWFFAYLFSKTQLFWNIVNSRVTAKDKLIFILVFSGISMLGTYLGIPLADGAIANIRPIGAIVAGYIGGPLLGTAVGLISGIHRYSLGGFTAFACGVATVIEGLSGGLIGIKFKRNFLNLKGAVIAGVVGELLQVGSVLALAKPFESALAVEYVVAIPMIVVNTMGVLGFCFFIREAFVRHNGMIMTQFNRFVEIERRMSQAVSKALSYEAVSDILDEIVERTELKGIFLLKNDGLWCLRGIELEIQQAAEQWKSAALKSQKSVSEPMHLKSKSGLLSASYYCVPLRHSLHEDQYALGVKLMGRGYYDGYVVAFTDRLAELMDNQISQYKLHQSKEALTLAQLKALKAQIQPHFLFNALSTISSFCRTDANRARELILDLAQYFRSTLDLEAQMVPLHQELSLITAYLHIEKARFGDRLTIDIQVPSAHQQLMIPVLTVQPLIENAIKFGVAPMVAGGTVRFYTELQEGKLVIYVENSKLDGPVEALQSDCTEDTERGCGKALKNIEERIDLIYGDGAGLSLSFEREGWAQVKLSIPSEGTWS